MFKNWLIELGRGEKPEGKRVAAPTLLETKRERIVKKNERKSILSRPGT